jgi:hypothetical protein
VDERGEQGRYTTPTHISTGKSATFQHRFTERKGRKQKRGEAKREENATPSVRV